ncbi:MAG: hypothetical protein AABZ06_02455 [Bdellovibrionota bacterium]
MFFRIFFTAAVFVAFAATGCSLRVGEQKQEASSQQIGGGELGCLVNADETTKRYFNGNADDESIDKMFRCISNGLDLFGKRARGKSEGSFTPQELRGFLERYFLDGLKISDDLLKEAMVLKRALLGGSSDSLALVDLERARYLIDVVRVQALRLRPFIPLNIKNMSEKTDEWLESAFQALVRAGGDFGGALEETGIPYSFERFEKLLLSLEPLHKVSEVRSWMPTIQSAKQLLVGTSEKEIQGNEWRKLFAVTSRWYTVLLRSNFLIDSKLSVVHGRGHAVLMRIAREAGDLIRDSIRIHTDGVIRFSELDQLIDSFGRKQIRINENAVMEIQTLKNSLRPLIKRFLGGSDAGPGGRAADGLSVEALERGLEGLRQWSMGQIFLEDLFTDAAKRSRDQVDSPFKGVGFTAGELIGAHKGLLPQLSSVDADSELLRVISKGRPFYAADDVEMMFRATDRMFSFQGLSRMNWVRLMLKFISIGYVSNPDRAVNGIGASEDEFRQVLVDFLPLAKELKVVDPRLTIDYHVKRIQAGSLFIFSGDGDGFVSIDEATELALFTISSKLQAARYHEKISELCNSKQKDVIGRHIIEEGCFWKKYFESWLTPDKKRYYRIDYFWDHMPDLVSYYRMKKESGDGEEVEDAIRALVASFKFKAGQIDSLDSELLAAMLQYVESWFIRFDTDQNGIINDTEATSIFSIFQSALSDIVNKMGYKVGKKDLRFLFDYVLIYGKMPSKSGFVWWKLIGHKFHSVKMNRGKLLQVLSMITVSFKDKAAN